MIDFCDMAACPLSPFFFFLFSHLLFFKRLGESSVEMADIGGRVAAIERTLNLTPEDKSRILTLPLSGSVSRGKSLNGRSSYFAPLSKNGTRNI